MPDHLPGRRPRLHPASTCTNKQGSITLFDRRSCAAPPRWVAISPRIGPAPPAVPPLSHPAGGRKTRRWFLSGGGWSCWSAASSPGGKLLINRPAEAFAVTGSPRCKHAPPPRLPEQSNQLGDGRSARVCTCRTVAVSCCCINKAELQGGVGRLEGGLKVVVAGDRERRVLEVVQWEHSKPSPD